MADTPLATAARLFLGRPYDDARRLALYEALSGAELILPLAAEHGDEVEPATEDHGGVPHVTAHDRPDGLEGAVATLTGLALVTMIEGQGVGVALRLRGLAEPLLVAPEAVEWLARSLAAGPGAGEARPVAAYPPDGLTPALLGALDRRIAQGEGLAEEAHLARVDWSDGTSGLLLAVVGAKPGAEETLAAGINAAVALSGAEGVRLDVTFLARGDPAVARLAKVGLRFDLSAPAPTGPPRLR